MVYLLTAGALSRRRVAAARNARRHRRDPAVLAEQRERLAQLPERLSAPDALSQLLQALDEAPTPSAAETSWPSCSTSSAPRRWPRCFSGRRRLDNAKLRPLLEAAADGWPARTPRSWCASFVARSEVSSEAIRRAGSLKAQAAVLSLSKILGEPAPARRLLAVQALAEIGSPGALQGLERGIEDADRDVRVAAVRAMSAQAYRPALARLETRREGKGDARGRSHREDGVLRGVRLALRRRRRFAARQHAQWQGISRRREDPEIRACAAIALGRVGTERAMEALRKSAAEKDIVVRNAVTRALRGGATAS